ncbi:stromal membrane-associated protein 1 isoform X1 [Bufo gargarizans]|uniref:stromal membrane-associated protein 1 isoform X1 n=1 Tax=Bufo gargarizans TaxID=30331 RepID=UPI001CF44BEE|nr:stromal membrane-associated protein 1 isoform X1 [Bufo gargarizans]
MATRSEREKAQKLNEQHQAILSRMLREDDNKYCADCEAKGPRWASWNLGVFICIRCAGIHRNLGVHISRVKSVNLDQWTPEQIQCMQDMGNTRARLLYEANLPENFRRPQTDQSVEFFIRDKYERKKYYDKNAAATLSTSSSDAVQPSASSPSLQAAADKSKLEKEKEKKREEKKKERESEKTVKPVAMEKVVKKEPQLEVKASPKKAPEMTVDLLGLDTPAEVPVSNGSASTASTLNDDLDIFGPMISNPLPASSANTTQVTTTAPAAASIPQSSGDLDLFTEPSTKPEETAKKPLSKDSILSLYGTTSMQQPNTTGMFMGSSPMQYSTQPTTNFQAFPPMGVAVPATTGLMGNMMGQAMPAMGQNAGMMVGMGIPNGFVGNTTPGVMGLPPNMMGTQAGMVTNMGTPPNKFGMQQNQPAPWNFAQMNQQMSGMSLNGASNVMAFGQPANTVGAGWSGNAAGQTLSTQLWK